MMHTLLALYVFVIGLVNGFRISNLKFRNNHKSGLLYVNTLNMKYDISDVNGVKSLKFEVAGKPMSFETGKIGRQAGGSVMARTVDTMVYSTVCTEREAKAVDFTPLRVDFFARFSAVGQTINAFHRRDSRGDDNEILVARLIDRPIRPMIATGWQHETQILTWVMSYDKSQGPEALAICASSAALCVSDVPLIKPVAGVEVGLVNGTLIVNPTKQELAVSTLNLTVAGTKDGILMIEGAADFLPESMMLDALKVGHEAIGTICDALVAFQNLAGKPKRLDTIRHPPPELLDAMDELFGSKVDGALSIGEKHLRGAAVEVVEKEITRRFCLDIAPIIGVSTDEDLAEEKDAGAIAVALMEETEEIPLLVADAQDGVDEVEEDEASELPKTTAQLKQSRISLPSSSSSPSTSGGYGYDPVDVKIAVKKLLVRRLRQKVLLQGVRPDGRGVEDMRPISVETSLLPGAHGSSLFTRGETQALATATLGSKLMEAKVETLDSAQFKRFYLQYRFPPSSVGEVGKVGMVNRREVGHGNLAERALIPAIPDSIDFPYSIRAESLITESCGSSSMATVCGCCMAMLDAGVPLKSHVAGVAMGLILGEKEGEEPVILTDILGLEDALGTMDFKVAGNEEGISTFQLDIKSEGLTLAVLEKALLQAKRGRLTVLKAMKEALPLPREFKATIPRILEFSVPPDCLGKIIGPKGKVVQGLVETFQVIGIDIQDSGVIQVSSFSGEKNEAVKEAIMKIVDESSDKKKSDEQPLGPPPEVGVLYRECPIISVQPFGVFVEVLPGYEGLVHVSELDTKKVESPEKAGFTVGQKIDVKAIGKNEQGKLRLSRRSVLMRDALPPGTDPDSVPDLDSPPIASPVVPEGPPPEMDVIYKDCEIIQTANFGVFVRVLPGYEGLVHISELDIKKIMSPEKAGFTTGKKIDVKLIGRNDQGKMRLSRKAVLMDPSYSSSEKVPQIDAIYRDCEIKTIQPFGVFVEILPGHEGLVHISELDIARVISPETSGFKVGQKIDVKVIGKSEQGRIKLSRKAVLQSDKEAVTITLSSASAEDIFNSLTNAQ